ncbi:hypothetical protein [Neisseria yangbaofengii]|uniref:hypothetical protein n=1 Tax=Neisseria yangbaofengii TaxID=2709396 RepID=UPI0013EC875A|nr:hypothetical protein [Neisseria yangbaofengii]
MLKIFLDHHHALSNKLKFLHQRNSLILKTLNQRIGISTSTLSKIKKQPTFPDLRKNYRTKKRD